MIKFQMPQTDTFSRAAVDFFLSPDSLRKKTHVRNPISPDIQVLGPDLFRDLGPKNVTPWKGIFLLFLLSLV